MALASRWKKTLVSTGSPSTEPGGGFRASPPPGRQPGLGSPTPNLRQPLNRLLESPRRKQPQVSKLRPLNPRHPTWWSQPKVPPPHSRKFLISSITFPSKHAWIWFVDSSTAHSNIPDLTEEELKKHGLCCRHQDWLPIWCNVEQDPGYPSPQFDVHKKANLHFCTSDVHRRWFILSECEWWKLEYLYLSMVQFVSLVFKISATEIVSVGIELISLALAEECRKILETRKKRRLRWWWVKPWIRRQEKLGASTQLLVELAAEDSDSYRNHLTLRRLMSYIYGAPILDVSRSHTTTQHSR